MRENLIFCAATVSEDQSLIYYQAANLPVVHRRLGQAGLPLAWVSNEAFDRDWPEWKRAGGGDQAAT